MYGDTVSEEEALIETIETSLDRHASRWYELIKNEWKRGLTSKSFQLES